MASITGTVALPEAPFDYFHSALKWVLTKAYGITFWSTVFPYKLLDYFVAGENSRNKCEFYIDGGGTNENAAAGNAVCHFEHMSVETITKPYPTKALCRSAWLSLCHHILNLLASPAPQAGALPCAGQNTQIQLHSNLFLHALKLLGTVIGQVRRGAALTRVVYRCNFGPQDYSSRKPKAAEKVSGERQKPAAEGRGLKRGCKATFTARQSAKDPHLVEIRYSVCEHVNHGDAAKEVLFTFCFPRPANSLGVYFLTLAQ